MDLSKELVNQFVKVTNDNKHTQSEASLFGSIVMKGETAYVRIDGSELLTPINTTAKVNDGDRVIVRLKNHMATVTGNITSPSTGQGELDKVVDQITEFEIVIADRIEANEIKVGTIVADNVEIRKLLSATNAEIENLKAENVEITGSLSANKAEIEDLKTKKLDAEAADIKFATIENLKVTNQEVNSIKGNFADFSVTTTEQLNAIDANIKNLDVEKLDAKDAEIKYANIDFANINMAAVEKLFAESGIIKDLVVGDTSITGELVGVTIKGDLIEANTLVADKLVVKGEDGLYYKLNTDGVKVDAEQTEYNSLNGSIITAKSITATKVSVDDLVAFDATIGGFNITSKSLYSGVKESVNNTTKGIYLDKDGQVAFGDSSNYLKFFKDTDGFWKLVISANSLKFSTSNKNVEEVIEDITDKVQKTVKTVEEYFAISSSPTTKPTTGWNKTPPVWQDGKYIWSKTKTIYTDGTSTETEPVCITGATGATGRPGTDGSSGVGIKSVTNYYLATSASSGVTESTSGWTTTIQTISTTNKYLWNYEVSTYTDNSKVKTTPVIIGVYGDKGQTGSTGATGIGIKSISEKYAVSTSNTTTPTTWYDSVQVMTPTNKYLWNYEIITYTNNTTSQTSKRVIGVYGDKGQTGATGATGVGISSVDVEYYLSTSNTTQTGGSWSTNAPTWVDGKYMWSRTKTTTTNGQTTTSKPVCITGGKGETGAAGQNGATGQGVESITEEYYLSTSKTTQSGGSWVTTPPTWSTGKYLWTRSKIIYKNPTATKYTTPVCDNSWEAVNEVEIGGSNMLEYTKTFEKKWNGGKVVDGIDGFKAYEVSRSNTEAGSGRKVLYSANYQLNPNNYVKGEPITLSGYYYVDSSIPLTGTANQIFVRYVKGSSIIKDCLVYNIPKDVVNKWIRFEITENIDAGEADLFILYAAVDKDGFIKISMPKMEKGNKATAWSPSPNDIENNLIDLESTMNSAFKDGLLSDAEKKSIRQSLNIIKGDMTEVDKTYEILNKNSNLVGTPKTNLYEAKTSYNNAYTSLVSFINTALNSEKVTPSMIDSIDSAFKTYRTTLGVFNQRIQEAIDSINSKKVDDINIGGRNLLINSLTHFSNSDYCNAIYKFGNEKLKEGEEVTLQLKGSLSSKKSIWGVYNSGGAVKVAEVSEKNKGTDGIYRITFKWRIGSSNNTGLYLYAIPNTVSAVSSIEWIKLEKGNKPTDWTPAPEDTEKVTNNLQTQITTNIKGIEALIKDTTITEGSSSTSLKDAHMSLKATVNGLNSTVANHTSSITTVKTDLGKIDGKINTAKLDAISTASSDATSKSNNALNNAKSYTNAQITTVNTRVSNAESSINQLKDSITQKVWQTDIKKEVSTITPDITYAKDYVKALEDNNGYRYKHDVIVYGDSDKYYPVIIKWGKQHVRRKIVVNRSYFEQAPNDWNNATQKGALNVVIDTNFGGWGGAQYSWSIYALTQTYGNTFAGCMNCGANVMFAIFLRGGGETGALYHLYSDQSLTNNAYNLLPDGTVLPAPQIAYNEDLIFYSPKSDGTAYEYYAPPPRTLTKEVLEEIQSRLFIDNANQARKDIATITTEVTTVKKKAATLETNLNGITSKVTNLESTTSTINGKVNSQETRLQVTEQKVTAAGVITTITDAVNSGTNSIKTTQFILDKNGATINNGKFISKDTSGKKKYELDGQAIKLYDYTVTTDRVAGAIESRNMIANGDIVGMSILCRDNKWISIDYVSSGNDDITQENSNPFARFWNPNDLYKRQIEFFKRVHLNGNSISFSQQNGGYDSYFKATGYQLSTYLPNPNTTINREYASWIIANNVTGEDHIILMPRQMEIYPYIWNQGGIYSAGSISSAKIVTQDISTDSYGIRSLNSYQTADALVSDFGEGIINDEGECIVFLDEVFKEIVNTNCTYRVILTAYDENDEFESIDLKCIKKTSEYFTVKSECIGLKFDWSVVAKEKDEEMTRLRNTKLTRDLSLSVKVSDLLSADDSIKSKDAAKQLTEQSYINLEINNNEDIFLKEFEINNKDILSEIEGMI